MSLRLSLAGKLDLASCVWLERLTRQHDLRPLPYPLRDPTIVAWFVTGYCGAPQALYKGRTKSVQKVRNLEEY